jgi:uncharacterized protein YjiS (DUF1127 family)
MTTAKYSLTFNWGNSTAPTVPRWSTLRFVDMLLQFHERARQRQALMALDDRLLKDIGVSRADAEREANKPFWRP